MLRQAMLPRSLNPLRRRSFSIFGIPLDRHCSVLLWQFPCPNPFPSKLPWLSPEKKKKKTQRCIEFLMPRRSPTSLVLLSLALSRLASSFVGSSPRTKWPGHFSSGSADSPSAAWTKTLLAGCVAKTSKISMNFVESRWLTHVVLYKADLF